MQIVDSHVHFWDTGHLPYAWLAGNPPLNRPFLPHDYFHATQGVEISGIIFVQADTLPEHGPAEAEWVASLDAPIEAIVAFAPLEQGEAARETVEQLSGMPLVTGVRRLIQSESADFAARPDFVRGVRLLADYGLRFDICIRHHQLPATISLVEQCPQVQFVLDHIAKPDIAAGRIASWRKNLRRLAAFPNVWCKLSGVITEARRDSWTPAEIRPYLDESLAAFGPERAMFGSDWPVVNLAGSFKAWLESLLPAFEGWSAAEKQAFFAGNARRFYGVEPGQAGP